MPVTGTIVVERLGEEYADLLENVKAHGETVPSRIGETREVLDLRLTLKEPRFCVVGRQGMSDEFMHEEIVQLLAGEYDGERLRRITPRAADLITAETAYGPRVAAQLVYAAQELEANPTSRRGVVYVGRHDDLASADLESRAREMPCTCVWQFHLREGLLGMSVYMRSWDLVWGLTYDVPSFVAVQLALAEHFGAKLGVYTHTAGSAHIYDRHYATKAWPRSDELDISHLLGGSIAATRERARHLMGRTD